MTREPRRSRFPRRRFLTAVGIAGAAGCASSGGDDSGTDGTGSGGGTAATPVGGADSESDHSTSADGPDWEAPSDSPQVDLQVETLIENLEIPWDMSFTGDGSLYLTERTGRVVTFDSGDVSEIARPQDAINAGALEPGSEEKPWWVDGGEGGTLGIAVHPAFPDEEYVYVYYTATNGERKNRVVRMDVRADDPAATEEVLVGGIPANDFHNGGRVRAGPDGNLWITTGDAGAPERAQDPSFLGGKILRITPEGDPAPGNPDLGGDPRVFSYGHRNPQGIDWLPSGVPVATEHGPTGHDEVNVLLPGANYGWNVARGGPDNDRWDSYTAHEEFTPPVLNTGPGTVWAPTGATVYTGDAIPAWQNRLVVGGLISQSIWVVTITPSGGELPPVGEGGRRYDADWMHPDYTATAHRFLQDELGRVRHLAQSPEGELYAITSNRDGRTRGKFPRETDDVLVRLTVR
ncbi:glucose sorbosone dehydrogenase [Halobellus salinus]|uniref:Glucose sorbosone dehydrogenase n=1 Tax=Halobellus salinus TaxID=931585 RepID=A0A830ERY2_9EURY|nr:PQQ-dependent sugar dehydrogenase [Halobellus salinus]GGJ04206.1 glucose sorbosone dehydrogenase [Halobellus salinus]SMP08471.1 Glucose/arabinose dehydrogenase, beta-propeller fold [Halobellus salinus]